MSYFTWFQRILQIFLVLAVILPISSIFLFLWGTMLNYLNDTAGASILYGITTCTIGAWFFSLLSIFILLGIENVVSDFVSGPDHESL
ncbi:MAG: hypothetical protein PHQ75_14815 [Thermoguttaceae bacterium]|nr:hypothetical protein [Thermoguttaceae bacterium]